MIRSPFLSSSLALLLLAGLAACDTQVTSTPAADSPAPGAASKATVCPAEAIDPATLNTLLGSVHEHSGFSDGAVGTSPADFFRSGRELGLDYMLSSDHSDNLRLPLTANTDCLSPQLPDCLQLPTADNPLLGLTKWEATADIADAFTDASFTAIRGFEWTSDRFGHINVYDSQFELNAKTTDGYVLSMEGFWLWFGLDPQLGGGGDGLLVFNHPGREDAIHSNIPDPGFTFNDFEFRPAAAPRAVGIEVFGKSGDAYDTDNGAPPEGWYAYALDKGWRLGPIGAEDEHGTRWGQPERAKTVILAPSNSHEDLRAALLARRFYALAQNHNDLRLEFGLDNALPGARVVASDGQALRLRGALTAGALESPRLEIVSNSGEVIVSRSAREVSADIVASPQSRWHYLRVLNADGAPVAYSAPIWVQSGDAATICGSS